MIMVQTRMRLTLAATALVALAACGGKSTQTAVDAELQRDLQLAGSGAGIELLPTASRTAIVSAIEQNGVAEPAPAPTRTKAPAARPAPQRAAPQPRVAPRVARTPTPQPGRQVERPRPVFDANVISPPPPGGYKTVDEVIRNAPFPIKP